MEIKDQIRIARESKGWTREKLADELGVTKQAITNWENGDGAPRVKRWSKIESTLGIKLSPTGHERELNKSEAASIGLRAEHVQLAKDIARLPKKHRDAVTVIVAAMTPKIQESGPTMTEIRGKDPSPTASKKPTSASITKFRKSS